MCSILWSMYPPPWPSCKLFICVHWLLSFQGTNPVQSWRECDLHLLEPSISAQCSPVHHFQNWFNIYKVTIIDENILYATSCKIQQNNNFHPQIYCCSGPWYLGSIHLLQAHTWPSGLQACFLKPIQSQEFPNGNMIHDWNHLSCSLHLYHLLRPSISWHQSLYLVNQHFQN